MKYFIIIVAALLLISFAVGYFFVSYSLKRHNLDFDFPEYTDPEVREYDRRINEHTQKWTDSQTPEVWTQKSSDGLTLVADFFRNGNSHKYVIVVHGYTATKETMFEHAAYFYDWGYNVLAPDNRAHGKSEGKWIGMGWLDSKDHLGWINRIVEKDPQAQITMLGVSMGGATVMMLSGLDLPSNVKCLIEDCGYSSVWAEFTYQLRQMFKLPAFPVMHISNIASKIICKYSLKEASSLTRLADAKVPMLFIHGTEDTFVPYEMLDENIGAYGGPYKEVLRVKNAPHGIALNYGLDEYIETVKNFIDKFIR